MTTAFWRMLSRVHYISNGDVLVAALIVLCIGIITGILIGRRKYLGYVSLKRGLKDLSPTEIYKTMGIIRTKTLFRVAILEDRKSRWLTCVGITDVDPENFPDAFQISFQHGKLHIVPVPKVQLQKVSASS